MRLLEINDLKMDFGKNAGALRAIDGPHHDLGSGRAKEPIQLGADLRIGRLRSDDRAGDCKQDHKQRSD